MPSQQECIRHIRAWLWFRRVMLASALYSCLPVQALGLHVLRGQTRRKLTWILLKERLYALSRSTPSPGVCRHRPTAQSLTQQNVSPNQVWWYVLFHSKYLIYITLLDMIIRTPSLSFLFQLSQILVREKSQIHLYLSRTNTTGVED